MLSQSENSERVLTINTVLGFSEGDLQMPAMIEMQKSFCPPDVSICNCCSSVLLQEEEEVAANIEHMTFNNFSV